jgi:hypothetical protein
MTDYPADEDELIFPSYRSQKAWDRYQQNFKHLLELAPGLKHLIGLSDSKKTAELKKIIGKVSVCAFLCFLTWILDGVCYIRNAL